MNTYAHVLPGFRQEAAATCRGGRGYGKRLRRHGGLLAAVITELARDTESWHDLLRLRALSQQDSLI